MPWFALLTASTLIFFIVTWDWVPGHMCLRALGLSWLSTVAFLAVTQPALLRRRSLLPEKGPSSPDWDARVLYCLRGCLLLLFVVAGWQSGRGGVPYNPSVFKFGAVLLMLATLVLWASCFSNPFFETQVRHQSEQGHQVIQTGPYGVVRHPGYLAIILMLLSLPIMLHSSAAAFPACLCIALLVARLKREESHLIAHLEGYAEYLECVQYRLIPRLW